MNRMKLLVGALFSFLLIFATSGLAHAEQNSTTVSDWTFEFPNFSDYTNSGNWVFTLRAGATNTFSDGDIIVMTLVDWKGVVLAENSTFSLFDGTKNVNFQPYILPSDLKKVDLTKPLTARIVITRGPKSTLTDVPMSFSLPTAAFPKKPITATDYVALAKNLLSKPFPYPAKCTALPIPFDFNDPYGETASVSFAVVDASGKTVKSVNSDLPIPGPVVATLSLCPEDFVHASSPFQLKTTVTFLIALKKSDETFMVAFPMSGPAVVTSTSHKNLALVCNKGTKFLLIARGSCSFGYSLVTFTAPNTQTWNALMRIPATLKGKNFILYGCVADFVRTSGGTQFIGSVSPQSVKSFDSSNNALFTADAQRLLLLSKADMFQAKVSVLGGYAQKVNGSKQDIASLVIRDFVKIGTC